MNQAISNAGEETKISQHLEAELIEASHCLDLQLKLLSIVMQALRIFSARKIILLIDAVEAAIDVISGA